MPLLLKLKVKQLNNNDIGSGKNEFRTSEK